MRGSALTTKERSYILGLFLGDGYANYRAKDRHYKIVFSLNSVKDKDIIKFLEYLLKKCGYNCYEVKDKRYNVVYIRVNSKKLFKHLLTEAKKLKSRCIVSDRNKILGLLSGLIDSEGYVGHGEILLSQSQKNYPVVKIMRYLADSLNLTKSVRRVPNTTEGTFIWRIRISTKFKNLSHISQKVRREYSGSRI